jgi:peptidoglycan LD-endopeptidase LytH
MRSTMMFLIGCVFGATGVLMWVHERGAAPRGLQAAEVETAEGRAGGVTAVAAKSSFVPVVKAAAVNVRGLIIPVEGFKAEDLRSDFHDPRSGGRSHEGIDIRAPRGTPVLAVADGTIKKLFTSKAGGLTIYHYDEAEEICYYYAHLDRYADGIADGMKVKRGTVIGFVGVSGNAPPDTPHLHFAVNRLPPTKEWWKGEAVDPYPLLTAR